MMPKFPFFTAQQLNLDWVMQTLKKILAFMPIDRGAVGDVLQRKANGAAWEPLSAVSMDIHGLQTAEAVADDDEIAIYDKTATGNRKATVAAIRAGVSSPVTSVNGKTGAVVLDADDVGALTDDYTPPVTSVNGKTGDVDLPITPTWYYEERSVTSNGDNSYNYTVNGDGWIIATIYIRSDATSDTGTCICGVYQVPIAEGAEYARGWSTVRLQTAQAVEIGTEAVGIFKANSGDTVSLLGRCTKDGTKRIRYSIMCFGCTLTAQ